MNPYDYPGGEPNFTLAVEKANSKWSRSSVNFVTAGPALHDEGHIARGEYFQPLRASNVPLAIILHGLGDHSVIPCKLLARSLVNRGIACLILYSVFHISRMPEDMKRRAPVFTSEEWFEGYRISVIEVRQAADWACSMPEINHEQISVVGISLGGFISAVAIGVEERLRAGVFITIGGEMLKQSLGRVRLTPSGKATIAPRRNADRSTHNTRNILLRSLRRDSPMLLH